MEPGIIPPWMGILLLAILIGFSLARFTSYRILERKLDWKGWVGIISALVGGFGVTYIVAFMGEYGLGLFIGYFSNMILRFAGVKTPAEKTKRKNIIKKMALSNPAQPLEENWITEISEKLPKKE